jgi:hypothetical protein
MGLGCPQQHPRARRADPERGSLLPHDAMASDPLWLRLRNHPSLFCLHPTPSQLAVLLRQIVADVYKEDMWDWGEVAVWLEEEAAIADAAAEGSNG